MDSLQLGQCNEIYCHAVSSNRITPPCAWILLILNLMEQRKTCDKGNFIRTEWMSLAVIFILIFPLPVINILNLCRCRSGQILQKYCALNLTWAGVDLKFSPWLLLFQYWAGKSDLRFSLCPCFKRGHWASSHWTSSHWTSSRWARVAIEREEAFFWPMPVNNPCRMRLNWGGDPSPGWGRKTWG